MHFSSLNLQMARLLRMSARRCVCMFVCLFTLKQGYGYFSKFYYAKSNIVVVNCAFFLYCSSYNSCSILLFYHMLIIRYFDSLLICDLFSW